MQVMQAFTTWFISQLPVFFMSEPICYLWGIAIVAYLLKVVLSLRSY